MPEGFAMASWHDAGWRNAQGKRYAEPGWTRMDHGAAPAAWRPRATARDAAAKCLAWTGGLGIPVMQVVDLATGEVVWRWGYEDEAHRRAGPWVLPGWHAELLALARDGAAAVPAPAPMRPVRTVQTRLF